MRDLSRRLGLTARTGTVIACVAVMAVLAGAGVLRALMPNAGFELMAAGDGVREGVPEEGAAAGDGPPAGEPEGAAEGEGASGVAGAEVEALFVVHVDGAVARPGVVRLTGTDLRVVDAIDEAGGTVEGADVTLMNLAAHLVDGQKVHVPYEGEEVDVASPSASPPDATASAGPVNVNTATAEELQALPGIGEATSAAIVEERERAGPFAVPEDLMRVTGIGEKKFERIKDLVCV